MTRPITSTTKPGTATMYQNADHNLRVLSKNESSMGMRSVSSRGAPKGLKRSATAGMTRMANVQKAW